MHPEYPLFVLANRDEARARPTELPQVHTTSSGSDWLGGTDVRAGGTWLGVNADGLLVAVTNRAKNDVAEKLQSRGILCRALLEQPSLNAARAEFERHWKEHEFAGFNLLLFSADEAVVIEAGDELKSTSLSRGIHVIANRGLNDPDDARVRRARKQVQAMPQESPSVTNWIRDSQRILAIHTDGEQPGLCLHRTVEWGTVSSTIVALAAERGRSKYFYAPGPPCLTAFTDYSPSLRTLFESQKP